MSDSPVPPESLLPYATWTEEALRGVVRTALEAVARDGLPGAHHFYITFRTTHPGVSLPGHLRAQFPREMTIVLQHRFWDLKVDREGACFSVGLSFGGVPAALLVPFGALIAFDDPHAQFGLRFQGLGHGTGEVPAAEAPAEPTAPDAPSDAPADAQVVSLAAFRRKRD